MRFLPQVSVFCTLDFSEHGHNCSECSEHGCESLSLLSPQKYSVHPLKHGCKLDVVNIFPLPQLPLSVCGSGMVSDHCMVREGMRQQELGRASITPVNSRAT